MRICITCVSLMDEVFGSPNFRVVDHVLEDERLYASMTFERRRLLVWYARDKSSVKYRQLYSKSDAGETVRAQYGRVAGRRDGRELRPKVGGIHAAIGSPEHTAC